MRAMGVWRKIAVLVLAALAAAPQAWAAQGLPADESAAVILAYHRVGEDDRPSESIRAEQFAAHVDILTGEGYHVAALPEVVRALAAGDPLPPRTVVITFEGGHRSILDTAVPLLRARGLPFTVFYAADAAGARGGYLSWADLKRLSRYKGASLGVLPARYVRLPGLEAAEARALLTRAAARHREAFGVEAALLSYPFGEYTAALRGLARAQGFAAALTLDSGAAHAGGDLYALPRFAMTERYGAPERLRLVASALPLPVEGVTPTDPVLRDGAPALGFTVPGGLELSALSCFVSGQAPPAITLVGGGRVELRPAEEITEPRTRLNCTLPGPDGRWRWYGRLLLRTAPLSPGE